MSFAQQLEISMRFYNSTTDKGNGESATSQNPEGETTARFDLRSSATTEEIKQLDALTTAMDRLAL